MASTVTKSINLLSNESVNGAYGEVGEYLPDLAPGGKDAEQEDSNMKAMFACLRADAKPWLTLDCGKWAPVVTFIQEALEDGAPLGNVMQVLLRSGKYPGLEELF